MNMTPNQFAMVMSTIQSAMQEPADKLVVETCEERGFCAKIESIGGRGWGRSIPEALVALAQDLIQA